MAHNSVDLLEEDAADLQFPKDPGRIINDARDDSNCQKQFYDITSKSTDKKQYTQQYECGDVAIKCDCCETFLTEPYIACAECVHVHECIMCFANGREFKDHRNDHSYVVRHDNFTLFSKQWTALEEKRLLDLVMRQGYGNWEDIGKSMTTKTPDECRNHYHQYYVDSLGSELLPKLPANNVNANNAVTPFLYNLDSVEDPPRFLPQSAHFNLLAGYRAARSDFDHPYDANAEKILNRINLCDLQGDDEYSAVLREVHCAVVRVYNHRLAERWRRYRIMRTHGLISPRKTAGWLSVLDQVVDANAAACFGKLMQLCDAENFALLIEGLLLEAEMKRYLFSLYHLRENGVTSLAGGELYRTLRERRERRTRECSRWEEDPCSVRSLLRDPAVQCAAAVGGAGEDPYGREHLHLYQQQRHPINPRRKSVPLNILGLPGYDRLSAAERDLCAAVRLIPNAYLTYRDQLIAEYQNQGSLRLGDARRLIKIDVNKTRQIYNHLIKEGYIRKPYD